MNTNIKAVMFNIRKVVTTSPLISMFDYERRNGLPMNWLNVQMCVRERELITTVLTAILKALGEARRGHGSVLSGVRWMFTTFMQHSGRSSQTRGKATHGTRSTATRSASVSFLIHPSKACSHVVITIVEYPPLPDSTFRIDGREVCLATPAPAITLMLAL